MGSASQRCRRLAVALLATATALRTPVTDLKQLRTPVTILQQHCCGVGLAVALAAAPAVAAPPPPQPDAARADVATAVQILDALSLTDRGCARDVLRGLPFTDAALPKVGGNVPRSARLFKGNYERPLPTVGNALRRSINAVEADMTFEVTAPARGGRQTTAVAGEDLYVERARSNAIASLDYLDLLRNDVLDAVQLLESELDDGGEAGAFDEPAAAAALKSSRTAAKAWLSAARQPAPAPGAAPLCAK